MRNRSPPTPTSSAQFQARIGSEELKKDAARAAREYLAALDDAAFGAASPVTPKFISRSDPAAQWTGAHKGHAFFAYAVNYLIDTDYGAIVDVEATRAIRQAEVGAAQSMLERTGNPLWREAGLLAADSADGFNGEPGLARQTEGHHAADSCLRQVQSDGRTSPAPTSPSIPNATVTRAWAGKAYRSSFGAPMQPPTKRRHGRGYKALSRRQIGLRRLANSKRNAARTRSPARSRVICTRTLETSLALSPRPPNTRPPVVFGKRLRCCSLISNESSASLACA